MLAVKEIYKTIQGEGEHSGRVAVFCRFAGCNLWSGLEEDRKTAVCKFCDTDFWGTDGTNGGRYSAEDLVSKVVEVWGAGEKSRYVVFTGGEPSLQLTEEVVSALRTRLFEVAIETNGTRDLPCGLDWVCVSPKAGTVLRVTAGDELKVVWPQDGLELKDLESLHFGRRSLQPKDGPEREKHTQECISYCLSNPVWRLSLQTHKYVGLR